MDRDELLRIIDEAAESGQKELNLSNRDITEIPPEIGKLTQIKELNLSYNQIAQIT